VPIYHQAYGNYLLTYFMHFLAAFCVFAITFNYYMAVFKDPGNISAIPELRLPGASAIVKRLKAQYLGRFLTSNGKIDQALWQVEN
jgi:hypothetical protein